MKYTLGILVTDDRESKFLVLEEIAFRGYRILNEKMFENYRKFLELKYRKKYGHEGIHVALYTTENPDPKNEYSLFTKDKLKRTNRNY